MAPSTNAYTRLAALYREAAERDPRRFAFGYLAGDPATGARATFVWFAAPGEMLEFLCTSEIALLQFDERDVTRMTASLRRAIGNTRDVSRLDRALLTAAFEGWCEIVWIGSFGDLCGKGGSFEKDFRAGFRARRRLGAHAGPITDDELDGFVTFVTTPDDDELSG